MYLISVLTKYIKKNTAAEDFFSVTDILFISCFFFIKTKNVLGLFTNTNLLAIPITHSVDQTLILRCAIRIQQKYPLVCTCCNIQIEYMQNCVVHYVLKENRDMFK